MSGAKRDGSGVFNSVILHLNGQPAAVDARSFHLGPHGFTFLTDHAVEQFTELGIQMLVSSVDGGEGKELDGRGVVVECRAVDGGRFEVSLLFLDFDAGVGFGAATVWTCDLTHGYIDINADYRS